MTKKKSAGEEIRFINYKSVLISLKMISRFNLVLIALFLAIFALILIIFNHFPGVFKRESVLPCSGCNIVIIDIDTLRTDALSCLGSVRNTSPNICDFFKKGVIFERNIAQSDWTLPSIFSTLTSQYPFTHGVYQPHHKLPQNIPTLTENLKSFGYQTTWVGSTGARWSVAAENGGLRGFDTIVDTPWEEVAKSSLTKGYPSFIYFYSGELHMPYELNDGEIPIQNLERPKGFPVSSEEFSLSLAEFLKENIQQVFTNKAINEHPEIFRNIQSINKYELYEYFLSVDPNNDASNSAYLFDLFTPIYNSYIRHVISDNQEEQRRRVDFMRMLYDTKVFYADKNLSGLLKVLQNPEISQNTIVVFLSDHGEEFGEHGQFSHSENLYQELLHTPLMIKIPGVSPRRVSKITENIDVFPTLIETVGIPYTGQTAGVSLLSLMNGTPLSKSKHAISFRDYQGISIQDDRWKLIADFSVSPKPIELYNLETDPTEQHNVIDSQKQKADELLKILIEKIEKFRTYSSKTLLSPSK